MNTQGLGGREKRKDIINLFKSKKYSICMLQDTHFTAAEETFIRSQWGYECYFSNFNSQSRGVAIFINNTFDFKLISTEQDTNGNLLMLNCKISDRHITLVNIYGPNRDNPGFYQDLQDRLSKYENNLFIIAGDFNLILNQDYDSYNYVHLNNQNARNKVLDIMIEYNLIDCWRENHLEDREYTWFRRNPIKKARLDFFLISERLYTEVVATKILPGYRTDHSMILTSFEFGKFKKGVSYWKFNNSLLKDTAYVNEIKSIIKDIKVQYATNNVQGHENIEDIPPQQLNFDISDQLFFETLLLAIRGKTIAYASNKKKLQSDKESKILSEIEALEKQTNINYELLELKRLELSEIRKKKMEGVFLRARAKWVQEGEKPTRYFCNLENRNYVSKFMNSLTTGTGEVLNTQDEILAETKRHYHNLYKIQDTEDISLPELLHDKDIPKLSFDEQSSIEGALTLSELLNSLKRMANNTSPGNDGFTVEFFKFFWIDIGTFLLRSINYSYSIGELSTTQKQGVITCIPKGNKDKSILKNWRPISLLNVSYKLASSSIAYRIKSKLDNIINEDQTGFLPGRLMATNIRLLYDILFYTEKHHTPGLLLLIDFAAAFDTVSWSFMLKVLEFFNFGPSIRKWIKLFYNNIESCVIVNGHMSEWFSLQRGCRQGDALSPYLFILCAEILAILLRNNPNIKGIKIDGKEYIVSQYADDTSLTLDGTSESLLNTLNVLTFYGRISGLKINTDKTKVIWFGSRKNSRIILCPEHNLSWENGYFTVLGIKFSTTLEEMVNINYDAKIDEITKLFACWSKRVITPLGKITVIKTLALAKLNHLILSIPNPSNEKINKIQNLFYKFLWKNSIDKVKRDTIIQDYSLGGLRMIDLKTFMYSLKASWLRRILKMNNKLGHMVNVICPAIKNIYKYGTDYIKNKLGQDQNVFWKDVLYSYYTLVLNTKQMQCKHPLSINIWYNPGIEVGGSSICYKRWLSAGIVFLGDLFNQDGELYSYREFNATFNIRTNFIEFNGLIRAVRNFIQKIGSPNIPTKSTNPLIPLGLSVVIQNDKGCRAIYNHILKKGVLPKSFHKWSDEIGVLPNTNMNKKVSMYSLVFKTTKDPKLIWFQYRINHRILATNSLLKKMNILAEDTCTFCNNCPETLVHLFWHCNISQRFWTQLVTHLNDRCNTNLGNWNVHEIIFGDCKMDTIKSNILLRAKFYLYYCRITNQVPSIEAFKRQIKSYYQTERYMALKTQQIPKFEALWQSYKNLIQ